MCLRHNCCNAEVTQALCVKNATWPLLAALWGNRWVWMKWRQMCYNHVLIELIGSASVSQQTRRWVGAAESKCQMRSCLCLGAATLRLFLSNAFHQLYVCFFSQEFRQVLSAISNPSICVVLCCQYAPLSLRPLTCEVKAGHRWGPREQGCIQFQRVRKRNILCM